jgi:hypothetical protein
VYQSAESKFWRQNFSEEGGARWNASWVWFHEDGKRDNGVFAQVALRAAKSKN